MIRIAYVSCIILLSMTVSAQVKIGENAVNVHPNALLELESNDKGLLLPRLAINDLNSSAPLPGTVVPGMMVYSLDGLVQDGQYTWDGNQWMTSTMTRKNCVIVKSESDFPAPVNGVIHLVPKTLYQINGTITVTNKIELHGCTIQGLDRPNDILVYAGTGDMFFGSQGGAFHNLILSAVAPGSKVFNLDANGALENLILDNVFIFNSASVGKIKGFGGFVVFNNCAYSNNENGIILENIHDVVSLNEFWIESNKNTFQTFLGVFHTIQKQGGRMSPAGAFNSVGMDITGITNIEIAGYVKNVIFCGDGIYVKGTFTNQWEIESFGLPTEKDDVASGNAYLTAQAITTFPNINVPVKLAGSTQSVGLFRVATTGSNRLQYTGSRSRRFIVNCAVSFISGGNNKIYSFYIAKNGIPLPESKISNKITSGSDQEALSISCTVMLAPGDYVEVWVENNSDNTSLTALNLNLSIK